MRSLNRAALAAALLLGTASVSSAQIVYVQSPPPVVYAPQPIVPVVSYSYYPPAPVAYAPPPTTSYYAPPPTTVYYAPPPTVAYYAPAPVVAPSYGVYSARTTTYGLGIFRPREVTTQYYYTPVYPR
jgi:hypothetical protein